MVKSAAKTAEKWKRRVAGAGADYKDGVQNPSRDWETEALKAKARYESEMQKSIAEGRREKGIQKTGSAGYKANTVAKSDRWATGVNGAEGKFSSAMGEVLAFEQQVQNEVNAMPSTTLEDRLARSTHWARRMSEFKKSR